MFLVFVLVFLCSSVSMSEVVGYHLNTLDHRKDEFNTSPISCPYDKAMME